jgi:hypothetical protein
MFTSSRAVRRLSVWCAAAALGLRLWTARASINAIPRYVKAGSIVTIAYE